MSEQDELIIKVATLFLVLYSVSLHELAHAYTATYFGDPTPGRHGRLTWDPLAQLLPTWFYSMVFPALMYLTNGFLFCYAFCPIDPSRFRKPLRDRALVALAGPVTNFAIMGLFVGLLYIKPIAQPRYYNTQIFLWTAYWNFVLGIFNLLPLPGLDGYDVLRPALPLGLRRPLDEFRRMGFLPMILAIMLGSRLLGVVIDPLERYFFMLTPYG
ncbi:MAG: site-2 protease family protein [Planctomycetota bacterium]|nr:site-2 protease family protein [Planctomycetota bacterium]